jgi:filamentous hemagglutinin family protein
MKTTATGFKLALGFLALSAEWSFGNPTGGSVTSGCANINTVPGTVTVNQTTSTAIINWQTFSIGSGELTKFIQPSGESAVLNRVLGGGTSVINGTLQANGIVLLVNGNGILVGPGGLVNTNGFLASTRDIADSDFNSGNYHFVGNGSGSVINQGTINGTYGVALVGKTVDNEGTINASNGVGALAAGDDVLINLNGTQHVFVSPSSTASTATGATAVKNGGTIAAAQAELAAANGNLYALAINNAGTIRATSVSQVGGRVFLTTDNGSVENNGSIAAKNGANGGLVQATGGSVWNRGTIDTSGATGGRIEFDAQNVQVDGSLTTRGTTGYGGNVYVTYTGNALGSVSGSVDSSGHVGGGSIDFIGTGATSESYLSLNFNVNSDTGQAGRMVIDSNSVYLAGATLNANGPGGNGHIYLGVSDPVFSFTPVLAQTLYIGLGTKIRADATGVGVGGTIVAQATGQSSSFGTVTANGSGGGTVGTVVVPPTPNSPPVVAVETGTGGGGTTGGGAASFEFVDPDPAAGNAFGRPTTGVFNLTSNTTLITSPGDSFGAAGAGAAYLFSDATGALLSTIRGTSAGDAVGQTVQLLGGSTFAVETSEWNGGTGAVTFGNGVTGFAHGGGALSALNSLIGSTAGDRVGSGGLQLLYNGNAVVLSPDWNGGAGAVTWVNPANGITGVLAAGNSLVGAAAGDHVGGGGVAQLNNGANYLVLSPAWGGGKGAVTNGSDSTGVVGTVSADNSLVGANTGDSVGSEGSLIDTNYGYYLITTPNFDGGAGAVTWNRSTLGTTGVVSGVNPGANSLVGSNAGDAIGGDGITILAGTHNYVVDSSDWNGGLGAVTLGNASTGITGVVSGANSLVGSTAGDHVGSGGVVEDALAGKYIVLSPDWSDAAGAFTLVSSTSGLAATVGADNSGVGPAAGAGIGGGGVTFLDNGNFLVNSPAYNSGVGALTFVRASNGFTGQVDGNNSLIATGGTTTIVELSNGANFLVLEPNWNGGYGAITEGNDTTGVSGEVNNLNSLVGAFTGDGVGSAGSVLDTYNNSFLVTTANYHGGAGAVTFSSDSNPTIGSLGAVNSLVGSAAGDHVGNGGITLLPNGNYVVASPDWNGGEGAATWASADVGVHGTISSGNSFIGAAAGDHISSGGVVSLAGGLYFVLSPDFNGTAGAVTLGGVGGVDGVASTGNSLVGALPGDYVGSAGSIINLYNFNYLVVSPNWDGGKGAVTYGGVLDGSQPPVGLISSQNSLVGSTVGDNVGSGGVTVLDNDNYLVNSPNWNAGTGAVTFGQTNLGGTGVTGAVSGANSLTGGAAGDHIGSGGVDTLSGGNYLILSPDFEGNRGAITHGTENSLATGAVTSENSFIGANAGDGVGSSGSVLTQDGYYLIDTLNFGGNEGAVTWSLNGTDLTGVIGAANSLVGSNNADTVGSGGITFTSNGYFVLSPDWNNEEGAITFGSARAGVSGDVGSSNSLVGATTGDHIGSGGLLALANGNYLALSPDYNGNAGAVSFLGSTGATGAVGATNSLYGTNDGDGVGSGGIATLANGNYLVLSPNWDGGLGAVTFGSEATGALGAVSNLNSLVGATGGDHIGSGGIIFLSNGNYLVQSPDFASNAGAVTWGSAINGISGIVTPGNSITGGQPDAGEEYAGESANGSIYLVSFTTDGSAGGNGRVIAGSTNGPVGTATPNEDFLLAPSVLTVEASNFNFIVGDLAFYIADPNAQQNGTSGVSSNDPSGSAVNAGSGKNLASGNSTASTGGPQRLVTPGNGIWDIFGGFVHSNPPPQFVLQQLQLSLSPKVYEQLNQFIFGNP